MSPRDKLFCFPKTVDLDDSTEIELSETAIYGSLLKAYNEQKVSEEELGALMRRSAAVDAINKAIHSGRTKDVIAGCSFRVSSNRLARILKSKNKPKGLIQRLLGWI